MAGSQVGTMDTLRFNQSSFRCPSWCQLVHDQQVPLAHEGETLRLDLGQPQGEQLQFLKIRTAQYRPLEADDETACEAFVEIEHHAGNRYRVMNLTSEEARVLAARLVASATQAEES
jgi:hypothetical protein